VIFVAAQAENPQMSINNRQRCLPGSQAAVPAAACRQPLAVGSWQHPTAFFFVDAMFATTRSSNTLLKVCIKMFFVPLYLCANEKSGKIQNCNIRLLLAQSVQALQ
jgi:hypothetical protein